jgi:LPXTG-site transpeptidase (sortase) family protein
MKEEEEKSLKLLNIYNISRLYSSSDRNEDILNIQNINTSSSTIIIGIIEISKINIVYPILSKSTDNLLKVSPCKFYGPLPNQYGNLCLAAHNYDDFRFFSKIDLLDIDDTINIYDNTGNVLTYTIYKKYETSSNDLSCTKQDKNLKEITLVTCNNQNGNRIIVKAKYNS